MKCNNFKYTDASTFINFTNTLERGMYNSELVLKSTYSIPPRHQDLKQVISLIEWIQLTVFKNMHNFEEKDLSPPPPGYIGTHPVTNTQKSF